MKKTILIGGKAGQGSAITSRFIAKIFCQLGYYVFNYRDYPSLISGGHNFNVLSISSDPIFSHREKYDIILALDQKTIDLHQKDLKPGGFLVANKNLKAKNFFALDLESIVSELKLPKIFENNIIIGWLFRYFGIDKEFIFKVVEKDFGAKAEAVKKAIERGYDLIAPKEKLNKKSGQKYLISGNEAISLGAIASGLDVYMAYPMTPATSVLTFLAKKQLKHNILVLQLENEIAVVNAALGSSFSGAKTMIGTSGGGFALMTEAISLAGMAELPLVVYLSQRTAPSTGVPTYTGQSDLKFALNAGHGEFLKIVVAPGDPQEAILRTQELFYLSAKYRLPAIILGDKHLGESDYSYSDLKKSLLPDSRFILNKIPKNYQSYQITKNGVSPRLVPGQGPVVRATSYEHNEFGHTIEDPNGIIKMNDKRFKKQPFLEKEIGKLKPVSIFGKGKNLIISWGSTKGAIVDALAELQDFRFLQISYLSPFPIKEVLKEIKKAKKVILIENNVSGLLGQVIREQTGFLIKNRILKYDARPFTPEFLINKIKKIK